MSTYVYLCCLLNLDRIGTHSIYSNDCTSPICNFLTNRPPSLGRFPILIRTSWYEVTAKWLRGYKYNYMFCIDLLKTKICMVCCVPEGRNLWRKGRIKGEKEKETWICEYMKIIQTKIYYVSYKINTHCTCDIMWYGTNIKWDFCSVDYQYWIYNHGISNL